MRFNSLKATPVERANGTCSQKLRVTFSFELEGLCSNSASHVLIPLSDRTIQQRNNTAGLFSPLLWGMWASGGGVSELGGAAGAGDICDPTQQWTHVPSSKASGTLSASLGSRRHTHTKRKQQKKKKKHAFEMIHLNYFLDDIFVFVFLQLTEFSAL